MQAPQVAQVEPGPAAHSELDPRAALGKHGPARALRVPHRQQHPQVPQVLLRGHERHASDGLGHHSGRLGVVPAQQQPVGLAHVQPGVCGPAERLDSQLQCCLHAARRLGVQRGVICVLVARRGSRAVRQQHRIDEPGRLYLAKPGSQRLGGDRVQHRRGRAALRHARPHGHPGRQEAVVKHRGDRALQQQPHPAADLRREAQPVYAAKEPATIEAIVGLLKV